MKQTVSRRLLRHDVEFMHKWCEYAASKGGSFAIEERWTESQWYTIYTINWPDDIGPEKVGDYTEG